MGQESQGSDGKERPLLSDEGAEDTVQELFREPGSCGEGTQAADSSGLQR